MTTKMLSVVARRIHRNFFMVSRLPEYRRLIQLIINNGYTFMTTTAYVSDILQKVPLPSLVCLLRNDVDSDPHTALAMFKEERALGIKATYYFRLSTLDRSIMREIHNGGSEVGYHYEELATVAKRLRLRDSEAVKKHIKLMKGEFRTNIHRFADTLGDMPTSIASHGDFANRKLKIANFELIDSEIRRELGLVAEAYDPILEETYEARITDREPPIFWSPESPADAIERGARIMRVLVHPRQWQCNIFANLQQDVVRLVEGIRFSL